MAKRLAAIMSGCLVDFRLELADDHNQCVRIFNRQSAIQTRPVSVFPARAFLYYHGLYNEENAMMPLGRGRQRILGIAIWAIVAPALPMVAGDGSTGSDEETANPHLARPYARRRPTGP